MKPELREERKRIKNARIVQSMRARPLPNATILNFVPSKGRLPSPRNILNIPGSKLRCHDRPPAIGNLYVMVDISCAMTYRCTGLTGHRLPRFIFSQFSACSLQRSLNFFVNVL